MTTMIIDNKASYCKKYESYTIDRTIYATVEELKELVNDCMNDMVFMITVLVNGKEIIREYNDK